MKEVKSMKEHSHKLLDIPNKVIVW